MSLPNTWPERGKPPAPSAAAVQRVMNSLVPLPCGKPRRVGGEEESRICRRKIPNGKTTVWHTAAPLSTFSWPTWSMPGAGSVGEMEGWKLNRETQAERNHTCGVSWRLFVRSKLWSARHSYDPAEGRHMPVREARDGTRSDRSKKTPAEAQVHHRRTLVRVKGLEFI